MQFSLLVLEHGDIDNCGKANKVDYVDLWDAEFECEVVRAEKAHMWLKQGRLLNKRA